MSIFRMKNKIRGAILLSLVIVLAACGPSWGIATLFVNPADAGTTSGHPTRSWKQLEKDIVNFALGEWNELGASKVPGTWTLRWEDEDLFKNWGEGADLSPGAGFTAPSWLDWKNYGGTDQDNLDFPNTEIYFNTTVDWFFDSTYDDDSEFDIQDGLAWKLKAKPGGAAEGKWDFLSVAKHELGHALGLDHLTSGKDGVMDNWYIGDRRHISPADKGIFYAGHPECIPAPGALILASIGVGLVGWLRRRKALR